MNAGEHCAECIARREAEAAAVAAWVERWPKHCRTCKGFGAWATTDFSTSTGGDGGPCESCTGATTPICPRCATAIDSDGNGPCAACGWSFDDADRMPVAFDGPCECEIAAEREIIDALAADPDGRQPFGLKPIDV